jgi:preprotein translocase subunit SecF
MTLSVAIALMVGCVLGVFSTVVLIGLAFAVRDRKELTKPNQEESEQHE